MIPVTQDQLYDPSRPDHRGNCWQTVLASVLELPLNEVPHFVQDEVDHDMAVEWHWWDRSWQWLRERGLMFTVAEVDNTPGEYLLVSGKSPRGEGIYHVVIYKDGEMVHDPHPDRSGLLTVDDAYVIRPIEKESADA